MQSKEFGYTYKVIEEDGFKISAKINIGLKGDSPKDISLSVSKGFRGFSKIYTRLKPNLILLLGDRFELVPAAYTATIHRIPICHLHGGEETFGLIDDPTRHILTKMSHFHFVCNKIYKKRVIQMGSILLKFLMLGEKLGVDGINLEKLITKSNLEKELKLKFLKRNILVTFHSITLDDNSTKHQFNNFKSLSKLKKTNIIFTYPNADTFGRVIIKMIKKFCSSKENSYKFKSLGQKNITLFKSC